VRKAAGFRRPICTFTAGVDRERRTTFRKDDVASYGGHRKIVYAVDRDGAYSRWIVGLGAEGLATAAAVESWTI